MSTKITNPNDGKNTDTVDVKPDAQAILEVMTEVKFKVLELM